MSVFFTYNFACAAIMLPMLLVVAFGLATAARGKRLHESKHNLKVVIVYLSNWGKLVYVSKSVAFIFKSKRSADFENKSKREIT